MMWKCFWFACLVFTIACSAKKNIPKVTPVALNVLLDGVQTQQRDFKYFSANAKVKFNGEEFRIGGRSKIRMIKDSVIWMNFKKYSVEGARVLITQDSFKIKYSLENCYEIGTFQEFVEEYNLNFTFRELQDFIIGNVFVPMEENVRNYESDQYHLIELEERGNHYSYMIREDFNMYRMMIRDPLNRSMITKYEDYNDSNFATKKDLAIVTPEEGEFSISIKLSSIEFDAPKKITFEIPSHYKKL